MLISRVCLDLKATTKAGKLLKVLCLTGPGAYLLVFAQQNKSILKKGQLLQQVLLKQFYFLLLEKQSLFYYCRAKMLINVTPFAVEP